ncbi:hypothetical protein BZA05DRAFT_134592 [Tricharina praecox]|uniref:uncharacterized protein n=1 Tax=Tricharina praecox TaxID=43433 RepID=UPI0022208CCA|nr:uncharacterized protein BZA05DRAFT_134592 [Tricharina praecox]KAI5846711.1 hypothetical protein BZA05DRAFT_134592 [Tricharina praecox]
MTVMILQASWIVGGSRTDNLSRILINWLGLDEFWNIQPVLSENPPPIIEHPDVYVVESPGIESPRRGDEPGPSNGTAQTQKNTQANTNGNDNVSLDTRSSATKNLKRRWGAQVSESVETPASRQRATGIVPDSSVASPLFDSNHSSLQLSSVSMSSTEAGAPGLFLLGTVAPQDLHRDFQNDNIEFNSMGQESAGYTQPHISTHLMDNINESSVLNAALQLRVSQYTDDYPVSPTPPQTDHAEPQQDYDDQKMLCFLHYPNEIEVPAENSQDHIRDQPAASPYTDQATQSPRSPAIVPQEQPLEAISSNTTGYNLAKTFHQTSPDIFAGVLRYIQESGIMILPAYSSPVPSSSHDSGIAKSKRNSRTPGYHHSRQ